MCHIRLIGPLDGSPLQAFRRLADLATLPGGHNLDLHGGNYRNNTHIVYKYIMCNVCEFPSKPPVSGDV